MFQQLKNIYTLKHYQTELQIALIARIDEFRTWKAEIGAPKSGEVVRSLVDVTFSMSTLVVSSLIALITMHERGRR